MKRSIVNMLAVFVLLLACTLGFAACGKKAEEATLKNEDVVGVWYTTQVVIDDKTHTEYSGTYTYARYLELDATWRTVAYDGTNPDCVLYYNLRDNILRNYKLVEGEGNERGTITYKAIGDAESDYEPVATWEIVGNQVKVYADEIPDNEDVASIAWAKNNDLAIITVTFDDNSVYTYTLAKEAA